MATNRTRAALNTLVLLMAMALSGCSYNKFTGNEEAIKTQWGQVQNQLQRRNDLIPNLVETTKGFAQQEKDVFTAVAASREKLAGAQTPEQTIKAANEQSAALARLLVIVENYPQLKSDATFMRLMDELAGTENRISTERMRYNERVQEYNTLRRSFPSNVTAKVFGFKEYPLLRSASDIASRTQGELWPVEAGRCAGTGRPPPRQRHRQCYKLAQSNDRRRTALRRIAVRVLTGSVSLCASGGGMMAQGPTGKMPATVRAVNQTDDPLLKRFVWRSIGPVAMGGRIDDVAVARKRPLDLLSGLRNRRRLEDREQRDDVHVDVRRVPGLVDRRHCDRPIRSQHHLRRNRRAQQPPELVVRRRRLQVDGWRHEIRVRWSEGNADHCQDRDTPEGSQHVYVAAAGHLFGPNPERGIYKTTDGGKTWTLVKFIDNDTGFIDMVMHPTGSQRDLGGVVSAPPPAVGVQRRWSGQWHLAHERRREDLDESHGQRPAGESDHRPHRSGHLPVEAERHPRADRSRSERRHRCGRQRGRQPGCTHADALDLAAAAVALPRPHPIRRRAVSGDPRTAAEAGGS